MSKKLAALRSPEKIVLVYPHRQIELEISTSFHNYPVWVEEDLFEELLKEGLLAGVEERDDDTR